MVRAVFASADPEFMRTRILGGFGSGESLIDAVAETEKRVVVREPEFARLLTVAGRSDSILSMLVRAAWDGVRLENRARALAGGKVAVDGAHVLVIADITADELRAKLNAIEIANGFANRFLFVCVRNTQRLPRGGNLDDQTVITHGREVRDRVQAARKLGVMHRSPAADDVWVPLYHAMCEDNPGGLLGPVIARDQAQMVRLQVAYALLDASRTIEPHHIEAAWAFWRYCRASAAHIFAGSLGDPLADRLLAELRRVAPTPLTATQQSDLFGRHASAASDDGGEPRPGVDDGPVLDGGSLPDRDGAVVAAQYSSRPHARGRAEGDVADDHGVGVHVRIGIDLRRHAAQLVHGHGAGPYTWATIQVTPW